MSTLQMLQDFMLTIAQEYYATMDDADRKEWVEIYMDDWDALKTYFVEVLEDMVRNDELRGVLLRTVKWYDVWRAMADDIADDCLSDDEKDTEENDEEHQD